MAKKTKIPKRALQNARPQKCTKSARVKDTPLKRTRSSYLGFTVASLSLGVDALRDRGHYFWQG